MRLKGERLQHQLERVGSVVLAQQDRRFVTDQLERLGPLQARDLTGDGKREIHGWVTYKLPKKWDFEHLVEVKRPLPQLPEGERAVAVEDSLLLEVDRPTFARLFEPLFAWTGTWSACSAGCSRWRAPT